jgi:hypothetical protein
MEVILHEDTDTLAKQRPNLRGVDIAGTSVGWRQRTKENAASS